MKISNLATNYVDYDIVKIIDEREFDRFARATANVDGTTCIFIAELKYIKNIADNVKMIITTEEVSKKLSGDYGVCVSGNPKRTFFLLFNEMGKEIALEAIDTKVGSNCKISKFACIADKNVIIGNNVVVEEFVSICEGVTIGDNCLIRAGAKIGVQEYNLFDDNGKMEDLVHYGLVAIGNDVTIGNNVVIGRALYPNDKTEVCDGCKIDSNAIIGHDVILKENVMIYASAVIGGSTLIGANTHIMMNSTVKNAIRIGENVSVSMGSNVIMNIGDNQKVFGNPAKKMMI